MLTYKVIDTIQEYEAADRLFREYAASLEIDLGFQNFDKELEQLQQMYGPANGGIILCSQKGDFIACAGVRKIDPATAELKRMYVQPGHQGKHIGRNLLEKSLALAKGLSYKKMRLDTLNSMIPAIHLYKKYGFYEIPAYYYNPEPTVLYFEKEL